MKKNQLKYTFVFVVFSFFSACGGQNLKDQSKAIEIQKQNNSKIIDMGHCICTQLWMPVCGENDKTYSNSCFANCAGVKFKQGSCAKTITE